MTIDVPNHPPLQQIGVQVNTSFHPPYYQAEMFVNAERGDVRELIAVVSDPAELERLATQLRQAGDKLKRLQEHGPTMPLPPFIGADLTHIEPAEAHTPDNDSSPRTLRRR